MSDKFRNLKEFCNLVGSPTLIAAVPDLKVVHCNSSIEDLFGQLSEDIIGQSLFKYFDERSQKRIRSEGISELPYATPSLKGTLLQLRRKSGRQLPVSVTTSLFAMNEHRYAIFTIEDLSEFQKVQNEKELLTEEVFQVSKLADIGRLAAGLAHELNNPLAIIQGFAEDLNESLANENPTLEQVRKDLEPILANSIRMGKIILKMMGLVRAEKPQLEEVWVKKIIEGVTTHFVEIFAAHGIKCKTDIAEDLSLSMDPIRVEQILINILNNATHALEKVNDRRIEISAESTHESVILKIWNNGTAISPIARVNMLTPFFTTKTVGEGMGLGLYLSYNIVKAHGGEIWFESSEDRGTAFFIKLPKVSLVANANANIKPRVIVVDDESFLRQILCKKLVRLGLSPVAFKNGQQALSALQGDEPFDGILTDLRMPQVDGWQLIETLKIIRPNLPVGIITSFVSPENLARAAKMGVHGVIGKPISDVDLENLVSLLLNKSATGRSMALPS